MVGASMLIALNTGWAGTKASVYLQSPKNVKLEPYAMVATSDGGVVVAGASEWSKQAWAFKLDAASRIAWSHFRDVPVAEQNFARSDLDTAAFRGAASTPDGGVVLCANTSYNREGPNMFLTRLSAQGKLIDERFIDTSRLANGSGYRLQDCLAWNGGVVIFGHEERYPSYDGSASGGSSYLVAFYNAAGVQQWLRVVSTLAHRISPDPTGGVVLRATRKALLVSATDNTRTELLKFDAQGTLTAQRQLVGRYLLVRNPSLDAPPKLYGLALGGELQPHTLETLAEDLSGTHSLRSRKRSDFVSHQVHERRDGSLLLFGAEQRFFGARLRAGILQIDANLDSERTVKPEYGDISPPVFITRACPLSDGRGFAYAVPLLPLRWGTRADDAQRNEGPKGAVISFID